MLTEELRRILRFVHRYCRDKGYSPSYKEIGEATGLRSVAHVQYRIDKLEALGYVTRQPKMARSVRVVRMPRDLLPADGAARRLRRRIVRAWRSVRSSFDKALGAVRLWLRRVRRREAKRH